MWYEVESVKVAVEVRDMSRESEVSCREVLRVMELLCSEV